MRRLLYFTLVLCIVPAVAAPKAFAANVLWTQYCQHHGKMKLLVHLDADPTDTSTPETVNLWLREEAGDDWVLAQAQDVDRLTATVLFVIESWPRHAERLFKVTCGDSE